MSYDNTDKGVLFKNKKKDSDNHPDYNGSINIGGVERWLSAWVNTDKHENKYMSLSIGAEKEQQPEGGSQGSNDEMEEETLPF